MTRKLVTFLGTGEYAVCHYYLNDINVVPTDYIQEAIVDLYLKLEKPIDEVHILLTPEAKKKNWLGENKLESKLEKYENQGLQIKTYEISSEQSIENIWNLFETIVDTMENDDRIIFDITHSFRFQPMLALLSLHFARVTKQIIVDGIYYGIYDPKAESKRFPIIDLTSFVDMQDWITNVYAFTKTGRVDGLVEWIKEKDQAIRIKERQATIDLRYVRMLANNWQELMSALQTNRSMSLPEMASKAVNSIESIKNVMLRPAFLPLNDLLTKVEEDIRPIANDDYVLSGFAAIEWCRKHGLYQQSYTIAEELLITAICQKYGFKLDDIEIREEVNNAINVAIKKRQKQVYDEEKVVHEEIISDLLKFPKLLDNIHNIKYYRNDINHAGWRKQPLSSKIIENNFDQIFEDYKEQLLDFYHLQE